MFSSLSSTLISSASSYFYLPVDDSNEDAEDDSPARPQALQWTDTGKENSADLEEPGFTYASASTSSSSLASDFDDPPPSPPPAPTSSKRIAVIEEILAENDLYRVLGVSRKAALDRLSLRRAYLSRSKACHPDKFPGNDAATQAFQKVNVAYDILSKPATKHIYDSRATAQPFDFFSTRPYAHADETFRSVVLGVFNDFLEGDLETVRTLLRAVNDLNPSLRLGDEGIDMVLHSLQSIRERALTCRACVFALHAEVSRLLDVQHEFRQLSYFDLRRRSRLTLELARIAISLPIALEQAVQQQKESTNPEAGGAILNGRVRTILRGSAVVLERLEYYLK